jgi:prevent-host-death family protein
MWYLLQVESVPIGDLKQALSSYIDDAANGERVVVTRHGRPVALIIGAEHERLTVGAQFGRGSLRPLLSRASKGRYLSVLEDDRRGGDDARSGR